jgi:hypothetical protein
MRRRDVLRLLGGAAVSWPRRSEAQPPSKAYRITVFAGATNPIVGAGYQGFLEELRRFGLNEGQNLTVDLHETDQDLPALSQQAADAVRACRAPTTCRGLPMPIVSLTTRWPNSSPASALFTSLLSADTSSPISLAVLDCGYSGACASLSS